MKKTVFGFIYLLVIFFFTATVLIVIYEKNVLMEDARKQAQSELRLMGTFVLESMLLRDYAQVEQALLQWGREREVIVRLRATVSTGVVLGEYQAVIFPAEILTTTHEEKIPGSNKTVTLEMEQDVSPVYVHIRSIVIRLAITWACLFVFLSLCLWWMFNVLSVKPLKKEISARKLAEAALVEARNSLEIQVEERTSALSEANKELQKEIVERKQAEATAQQARQDWESIFQAIGHPVMILDPTHGLISANESTVELFGLPEKELIGKQCYELMHNTDKPPEGCPMQKMMVSGCKETNIMAVESFGRLLTVTCTPIIDSAGKLQKCIHIAMDITEQKQAETELKKYREHLEELVEDRTQELETKNAELERMNKLFVGRELRIKELKEKVKEKTHQRVEQ